ncbi:MAG TPA: MauE/DoxX family redox-associated membrane protein [Acidimicrobiales bacterium]|nr:MauE/DoxX family redox-associated membrane protein [Acidimicrobiales bacterium]
MPALTGPALTAALLLVFAGAMKAVDPVMTAGALRALGLPSSKAQVRVGAGAELVLGLLAVTAGWVAVWWLVAASYVAFAAFVVAALRAGTMVGTCGCFGRKDTPPRPIHVAIDVALAATAAAAAVRNVGAPLDAIADAPGEGSVVAGLSVLAVALLYAILVDVPGARLRPGHGTRRRLP